VFRGIKQKFVEEEEILSRQEWLSLDGHSLDKDIGLSQFSLSPPKECLGAK